jgi:hypothetical protein
MKKHASILVSFIPLLKTDGLILIYLHSGIIISYLNIVGHYAAAKVLLILNLILLTDDNKPPETTSHSLSTNPFQYFLPN